jgi:hypothetical protein
VPSFARLSPERDEAGDGEGVRPEIPARHALSGRASRFARVYPRALGEGSEELARFMDALLRVHRSAALASAGDRPLWWSHLPLTRRLILRKKASKTRAGELAALFARRHPASIAR